MLLFLLGSSSLLALIYMLTASVLIVGLQRTSEWAEYKPWLRLSLVGSLLAQSMNFVVSSLIPEWAASSAPYTSVLYIISGALSQTATVQVAYLFPGGAFEQERRWVVRIVAGLYLICIGRIIWYDFFTQPQFDNIVKVTNALGTIPGVISTSWILFTYFRKARYFRQHNPAFVMPSLLLAFNMLGFISAILLVVYPGASHPLYPLIQFSISWPLYQYTYVVVIIYSTIPIRFQDKLVAFAFASIMTILTYTVLLLIPFTNTVADRIAHQHELRMLTLIILGSAVFVLWVFPVILRVSLVKPLGKLLAGIKQVNGGDLSVQVPVGILDEFGALTQNFNQMTQSLKKSTDDLTQYAETLEVRVADRTAELSQKNQELVVEAALEKVRTQSMAMQQSDQLQEVIHVICLQLQRLGFQFDFVGFVLLNGEGGWHLNNATPDETTSMPFYVPYLNHKIFNRLAEAVRNGTDFYTYSLTYEEKNSFLKHLFENTILKETPEVYKQERYNLQGWSASVVQLTKTLSLSLGNYQGIPYTEEENVIFRRFGAVFGQAYTRFLDLQKAEAQALEAQIEAALERVRSASMALQTSEGLKDVGKVVFSQLQTLGFVSDTANFITDFNEKGFLIWGNTQNQGFYSIDQIYVPFVDNTVINFLKRNFEEGNELVTPLFTVDEKNDFFTYLYANTSMKYVVEARKQYVLSTKGMAISIAIKKQFCLAIANYIPTSYTQDQNNIIKRFATVFEQAYTRFLDLQKAESQALEAVRTASLDRVRAEIASMRTPGDLERITPLIWNELSTLGVPFIRCGVFIMDEQQQQINTFLSTPDGKAIASFNTPFANPGLLAEALPHWQNGQIYQRQWDEATFVEQAQTLISQGVISSPETYLTDHGPTRLYLHLLPFLQGMLYVGNDTGPLTDDQLSVVQTLADAFSTAYARYEDFNKLEAAKKLAESTLTELKVTQTQLIQKEKMASLGELTAGIAHEIQNPLNFVNNFSEVSTELIEEQKEALGKGDTQEAQAIADDLSQNLQKITLHGQRASSIVKGMLEHSRTSTGQKESTNLNALADEYLRLAYQGFRAKDKSFTGELVTHFEPDLAQVEVVPQEIGRVLLNLYNNAFYAVGQQASAVEEGETYVPTVWVSTHRSAQAVEIRVKDNGTGIPEAVKAKIFQPFFTTKPTGEGTGLGLSLSYDIVTKGHGGTLTVESQENIGTTFILRIPTN